MLSGGPCCVKKIAGAVVFLSTSEGFFMLLLHEFLPWNPWCVNESSCGTAALSNGANFPSKTFPLMSILQITANKISPICTILQHCYGATRFIRAPKVDFSMNTIVNAT